MYTWKSPARLLVIALLAAPGLAADTIESAEKQIVEQNNKIKGLSAKLSIKSDTPMGSMNGDGTVDFSRHGDKSKWRVEMKMTMQQGETKNELSQLVVSDGEFAWNLQEFMGQKQCIKQKADESMSQISAKGIFDQLRKQEFTLKLLPDETFEGKPVWTIEATPKEGSMMAAQASKVTLNFSKDSGLFLRQTAFGKDGKPAQTVTVTDVKIDPNFAPDRFEFKAPEGVTVTDMTGGAPAGAEEKK